jgi:hypothetical protein
VKRDRTTAKKSWQALFVKLFTSEGKGNGNGAKINDFASFSDELFLLLAVSSRHKATDGRGRLSFIRADP